jgi:HK97 gp10 family phage protein
MSVGIFGVAQLVSTLRKAKDAANKAAEREVKQASKAVETTAKNLILKGPKTGEFYKRGRKWHQASAPGEAPANDGGKLASSIMSKMEVLSPGVASAVVWANEKGNPYGAYLEFGTEHIEPRPFMTPALESNRAKFPKALGDAVVKACEDAAK